MKKCKTILPESNLQCSKFNYGKKEKIIIIKKRKYFYLKDFKRIGSYVLVVNGVRYRSSRKDGRITGLTHQIIQAALK